MRCASIIPITVNLFSFVCVGFFFYALCKKKTDAYFLPPAPSAWHHSLSTSFQTNYSSCTLVLCISLGQELHIFLHSCSHVIVFQVSILNLSSRYIHQRQANTLRVVCTWLNPKHDWQHRGAVSQSQPVGQLQMEVRHCIFSSWNGSIVQDKKSAFFSRFVYS